MTRDIGVDSVINRVRLAEVASPSSPPSGYGYLYAKTNGLFFKGDNGTEVGPLTSGSSLANSNISPTTGNINASANTRYFADISGLTANRNFIVPAGAVGDSIELNIKTGDNTFALIIIGDTGVSINGGSTATEWSRVFITGEVVRLVADTTSNWQVIEDGRIPCLGLMTLSTNDTTNTAGEKTLPTWDNKVEDIGEVGDTTNKRFNIRRAGRYKVSGLYEPAANVTDAQYTAIIIYLNGSVSGTLIAQSYDMSSAVTTLYSCVIPPVAKLCAVGDYLDMYYQTQGTNVGCEKDTSWFQVEEYLKP